ncbi:hypothetical protein [Streptomyces sp. NBC_00829]|uniref:hypothetical protein n=1 Tax=Streptomyces sp. NBC_00829 TaxID=2903679 RepID=UPI00386D606A|nr:hypothetical protein OG293_15690 [Streptomyces sp. NBC_00829]
MGNIALSLVGMGAPMLIAAIWVGGSVGYPGLFMFLAGLFIFGLSPEGRAAEAARKGRSTGGRAKGSIPSDARKLLELRLTEVLASAPGQEDMSVVGARATVESSGAIVHRATVTRIAAGAALAGPVGALVAGLAAKKKIDDRHIFVVIENPEGAQLLLAADKKRETEVRRWATRFNTWAGDLDSTGAS